MTNDERPRPQYGEYASPQEQAKAIAQSQPLQSTVPSASPASPASLASPVAPTSATPPATPALDSVPGQRGSFNRLATIVLLALGLVYLIGGASSFLALPQTLGLVYQQWGIGDYLATSFASTLGIVVVVAQAVIWLVVAVISLRRLRTHRTSWWVPIVGAVATFIVTVILMAVVIMSDPAFTAYLTST